MHWGWLLLTLGGLGGAPGAFGESDAGARAEVDVIAGDISPATDDIAAPDDTPPRAPEPLDLAGAPRSNVPAHPKRSTSVPTPRALEVPVSTAAVDVPRGSTSGLAVTAGPRGMLRNGFQISGDVLAAYVFRLSPLWSLTAIATAGVLLQGGDSIFSWSVGGAVELGDKHRGALSATWGVLGIDTVTWAEQLAGIRAQQGPSGFIEYVYGADNGFYMRLGAGVGYVLINQDPPDILTYEIGQRLSISTRGLFGYKFW